MVPTSEQDSHIFLSGVHLMSQLEQPDSALLLLLSCKAGDVVGTGRMEEGKEVYDSSDALALRRTAACGGGGVAATPGVDDWTVGEIPSPDRGWTVQIERVLPRQQLWCPRQLSHRCGSRVAFSFSFS